jgi:hypothetical protein
MKKLYFGILFLSLVSSISAQARWTWGANLQLSHSGERVKEAYDFDRPGGAYGSSLHRTVFDPSFAGGAWVAYRLGLHWSLQTALQYRQLVATQRYELHIYDAAAQLNGAQLANTTLRQHSLEVPLRLRYYLTHPLRQARPFVSIQAAPAYLLSGEELTIQRQSDLSQGETQTIAYRYPLDFQQNYVSTSPLQLTYGAEIGIQWQQFALSLTHNRSLRAKRLDYDPPLICCFGDCVELYRGYNAHLQTRILQNTNLQLQYQF